MYFEEIKFSPNSTYTYMYHVSQVVLFSCTQKQATTAVLWSKRSRGLGPKTKPFSAFSRYHDHESYSRGGHLFQKSPANSLLMVRLQRAEEKAACCTAHRSLMSVTHTDNTGHVQRRGSTKKIHRYILLQAAIYIQTF